MNDYAIVTNRKRAVIALVHSVVFLLIALRSVATAAAVNPVWLAGSARASSVVMLSIYLIVSSVLIKLVWVSRCTKEKLYFGFCASSASVGVLRYGFGDLNVPAGQYLRVIMLLCAVVTGSLILRRHSKMAIMAESGM